MTTHTLEVTDLKTKSLRGGMVTVVFQAVDAVVRIGSIAVLARALMPADFGLVAMVTAITAIAEQFKDIGLSTATVQKKSISHEEISKLFWVNVVTGAAIAALICAAAAPIADFFHDGRLVGITIVIASGFVWSGAAIQHQALLRRQMRYTAIGAIQVVSTVISTGAATVLALQGYGYWALVWREVLRNVFIAIGTWLVCPWIPDFPRRHIDINGLIKFGGDITAFNIIVFLSASVDQLLIGRAYGATQLGMYRQAYQLVFWPVMQLTVPLARVAESTLSCLQDTPERYRAAYHKLLTIVNFVMMPLVLFAAIYAEEIVLVVLGHKWVEAAPLFRILALATFIRPASDSTGLLLVTCGKTRRYLMLGIATGVILLLAFGIGILWGPLGVAYGSLAATYSLLGLRLYYAFDGTPVSAGAFCRSIGPPLVASVVMAAVLLVLRPLVSTGNPLAVLTLAASIAGATYLLAWLLIPGGRTTLGDVVRDLRTSLTVDRPSDVLKAANLKRILWSEE